MRGNYSSLTLGNSARAMLLSVMILGTTLAPVGAQSLKNSKSPTDRDSAQSEESAFAVPRLPDHGEGASLPHPLSAGDAAAVRDILRIQREGQFDFARIKARNLKDPTLLGDILAERYLSPAYHPEASELRGWLSAYPDLADAAAIQERLLQVAPKGSVPPRHFVTPLSPAVTVAPMDGDTDPAAHLFTRNPLLDRTVTERLAWGLKGANSALHLVETTPGMTPLYGATLRSEIALAMLGIGESDFAYETARTAYEGTDRRLGQAAYVAGLAAWRKGDTRNALEMFTNAAHAALSSDAVRAGAAYWAARSERKLEAPKLASLWLHHAASVPDTFYGMLAHEALGQRPKARSLSASSGAAVSDSPAPVLAEIDVEAVAATPQGRRVFALLQVGETARAESALRNMWPHISRDNALCRSVQLVAAAAGMDSFAQQVDAILAARSGTPPNRSDFPLPPLHPRHGFRVDPALIYALTRLESNFDAGAASSAGAHGLMQIRPLTASFVTSPKQTYDSHGNTIVNVPADIISRLHNPSLNLEIGQLYVLYLATLTEPSHDPARFGDLIHVLAAYNAGPNALGHWEQLSHDGGLTDPLMFLETLPIVETRDYVRRALMYTWIYAAKLSLPTPSLHRLAHAEWPQFAEERTSARAGVTLH